MANVKSELLLQVTQIKSMQMDVIRQIEFLRNEYNDEDVNIINELEGKLNHLNERLLSLNHSISTYQETKIKSKIHKERGRINIGSTINLGLGRGSKTITLVLPEDANTSKNYISSESPLGKAVIGKSFGEIIKFETPSGEQKIKIKSVT